MIRSLCWVLLGLVAALAVTLALHYAAGRPRHWQPIVLAASVIAVAFLGGTLAALRWGGSPDSVRAVLLPLALRMGLAFAGIGLCLAARVPWQHELLLLAGVYYLVALGTETAISYRTELTRGTDGSRT